VLFLSFFDVYFEVIITSFRGARVHCLSHGRSSSPLVVLGANLTNLPGSKVNLLASVNPEYEGHSDV